MIPVPFAINFHRCAKHSISLLVQEGAKFRCLSGGNCDLVSCPFADPQKIMVEKLPCNIRLGHLQPGDIPFLALERVSPFNELQKCSFIIGILSEEYLGQRVQPRLLGSVYCGPPKERKRLDSRSCRTACESPLEEAGPPGTCGGIFRSLPCDVLFSLKTRLRRHGPARRTAVGPRFTAGSWQAKSASMS